MSEPVQEFVLARLAEETILRKWAAKVTANVRGGLTEKQLRDLAATWHDHPDYRGEWA